MKIIFINYGDFGNNSSNHLDAFAAGLVARGHEVIVLADGQIEKAHPGVSACSVATLEAPESNPCLHRFLTDPETLVHAWTPREKVRRLVEPLAARGLRYIVHLEDEEDVVTASQLRTAKERLAIAPLHLLDATIPDHLAHPVRSREFLARAAGVTAIVQPLLRFAPAAARVLVLEPGADLETFRQTLGAEEREAQRAELGIDPDTIALMYHGGVHPAVQRDMFSLYTAVGLMCRAGRKVVLLRCGTSDDIREKGTAFRRGEGVVHLGFVSRDMLPRVLELADIYVQPGWPNPFNAHRLPSKLLDFFSMGRPVILPKVNLGERLRDGEEAVLLQEGGAPEIIRCVNRLAADPDLRERVGCAGRRWVEREFNWADKIEGLEAFYASL